MTIANVRLEQHDDTPVAFLNGDVDAANAFRVGEELIAAVTNRAAALIVVLSDIRYLDSAGINLLFRLHDQLGTRRQRLGLVLSNLVTNAIRHTPAGGRVTIGNCTE